MGDDIPRGSSRGDLGAAGGPQFEGQTKGQAEQYRRQIRCPKVCGEQLRSWFDANPAEAKTIVTKAVSSAQARMTAARYVTSALRSLVGCRASWLIAAAPTRANRNCLWWRAIRPVARRKSGRDSGACDPAVARQIINVEKTRIDRALKNTSSGGHHRARYRYQDSSISPSCAATRSC